MCSGCNESLAGNLYRKYRKPLMSATTALIVGAYGGYKVTDTLQEEARYPLRAEYAIVEACINASARPLSMEAYERKRDICLCAFEGASRDIGYERMEKESAVFVASMRTNAAECSPEGRTAAFRACCQGLDRLLPRRLPDGFPVLLGPFGGVGLALGRRGAPSGAAGRDACGR